MAQPKHFAEFRENNANVLFHRPALAFGSSVVIYDPILAEFYENVNGAIEPDKDDTNFTTDLAIEMSRLFTDENTRRDSFANLVEKYFSRDFVRYTLRNNRTTDLSVTHKKFNEEALLMNVEIKPENGMGNGCAYLQNCIYYMEFINHFNGTSTYNNSRLPTFLLQLTGLYCNLYKKNYHDYYYYAIDSNILSS